MKLRPPRLSPEDLRSYQWRALKFVIDHPFCALFLEMGLGKTIAVLSAVKHLFHKNRMKGPVLVIAPIRVIKGVWRQEALKWSHTKKLTFSLVHGSAKARMMALARPAHVYLINPEGVKWLIEYYVRLARGNVDRFKKLWPFKMLVVDECFTGETLVTTPVGKVRIDSLTPGDKVLTTAGIRKVRKISSHGSSNVVQVQLPNGETINATPHHPFFTTEGWVCAGDLDGKWPLNRSDLSFLSERIQGSYTQTPKLNPRQHSGMLQQILCSEGEMGQHDTGKAGKTGGESFAFNAWEPSLEQRDSLGRRDKSKVIRNRQGQETRIPSYSWRQRYRDVESRSAIAEVLAESLHLELPGIVGEEARGLSHELQTRLRRPSTENRDRSGRPVSQKSKRAGLEKGDEVGRTWVDRIPDLKRRSVQPVWNLEIEGCPHFFVGEYEAIVHNSTFFKDGGTQRFKALKKTLPLFERRVILTGTPAPNSLMQIWSQMFIVDCGVRLGTAFTGFRDRFFQKEDYMGYSFTLREGAKEYIDRLIRPIVLRLEAADWLELPPLVKSYIRVDLPPHATKMYEDFEREMFLELDTAEVEAMHAATLTMRCHQIANGAIYALDKETAVKDWYVLHDAKVEALKEYIEELEGERALICFTYKHDLARLRAVLPDAPTMTPKNTESLVLEWAEGKHQFILIHPQSGGHGVNNLQVNCRRVLFFSIPWSGEHYDQIIARVGPARRSGEKEPTLVTHIMSNNTVDEVIVTALDRKATAQRDLLDALKEYRVQKTSTDDDWL